jgi:hypothetical protein
MKQIERQKKEILNMQTSTKILRQQNLNQTNHISSLINTIGEKEKDVEDIQEKIDKLYHYSTNPKREMGQICMIVD